jgi:hypothetical protein
MIPCYQHIPQARLIKQKSCQELVKIFTTFNREFNCQGDCKLEDDLEKMNCVLCLELDGVILHFIGHDYKSIPIILHALSTFICMFPAQYQGLVIYVCLDRNARVLDLSKGINEHRQDAQAFTVSGLTERSHKEIHLTKQEELVKLLFHELIHYIGLDSQLMKYSDQFRYYEAYTEFLSVLLHSAYYAITFYLQNEYANNIYELYHQIVDEEIEYSVRLASDLLKHSGYDQGNYKQYFHNATPLEYPIPVTEYVLLRSNLLLNHDQVLNQVNQYRVHQPKQMIIFLNDHDKLVKEVAKHMHKPINKDMSYLKYDVIEL